MLTACYSFVYAISVILFMLKSNLIMLRSLIIGWFMCCSYYDRVGIIYS